MVLTLGDVFSLLAIVQNELKIHSEDSKNI